MRVYTYFKTQFFELREQRKVKKQFYSNIHFKKLDQALLRAYRLINPYKISKDYLQLVKAQNIYAYGETPLTTIAQIVDECEITAKETVIEMGAGRGRAALFLAEYVGCKVLAFEEIPQFVEKMVPAANLKMVCGDMFMAPFADASVIFLYGTMLEDNQIRDLVKKFPFQTKIITVSYPLSDYSDEYRTKKSFSGIFPWGKTEIYWNERFRK